MSSRRRHRSARGAVAWGRSVGYAGGLVLAILAVSCGTRTDLVAEPPDGADAHDAAPDGGDGGPDGDGDARLDADVADAVPDGDPGVPCATDRECLDGDVCLANETFAAVDLEPLPLRCGPARRGAVLAEECEVGTDCDHGICLVAGTCTAPCRTDAECGALGPRGRCADVLAITSPSSLQPLRGCVAVSDVPPGVESTAVTTELEVRGRGTERVHLPPPATSVDAIYQVLARDRETVFSPTFLRTADPASVNLFQIDDFLDPAGDPPLNPVGSSGDVLSILVGNGPRSIRSPAGYEIGFVADRPTLAELHVTERVAPAEGLLDLDIYFAANDRWLPEGDRGPEELEAALREVERLYAPAGIRLGRVRQHVIVGLTRRRLGIIEADREWSFPELDDLFRLSAGAGRPSVNLFLVRTIENAIGISGSIPGPLAFHGRGTAGVAIAIEHVDRPSRDDSEFLGLVIAHEVGHHLGLFHTSEGNGLVVEPLPDTPECRADRDLDEDGFLMPYECGDAGAQNVMFWAAIGGEVSPDQAGVLRESVILR